MPAVDNGAEVNREQIKRSEPCFDPPNEVAHIGLRRESYTPNRQLSKMASGKIFVRLSNWHMEPIRLYEYAYMR
jgi:hypothetical protein